MPIFALIIGLLIFVIIIAVHEGGHMQMAKHFDVHVEEYAIGFGPKIKSWKKDHTNYSVRWIPLGGYVMLADEDFEGEIPEGKFKLQEISKKKQILVMLAGIICNIILALLVLTPTFMWMGSASDVPVIGSVSEGYPAEAAGIRPGDEIFYVDGHEINTFGDLSTYIPDEATPVEVVYGADEATATTAMITPSDEDGDGNYIIGVGPSIEHGFLPALKSAILAFPMLVISTVVGLLGLFTGLTSVNDFVSPIGVAEQISVVATKAPPITQFFNALYLMGIISMAVGAFNLLPIPPLDGGKVMILVYEGLTKKVFNKKIETWISLIVFGALMLLGITVMLKDLIHWVFK